VNSRLLGAVVRAGLVMAMVALPAAVLTQVSADTKQMVTFAALLLGAITFAEYNATYPSLIEFRDAAPFNRLRFAMLTAVLGALSLAQPATIMPEGWQLIAAQIAGAVGAAMDFPFSPARLVLQLVDDEAQPSRLDILRNAAGLAYLISLSWLALFAIMVRIGGWPNARRPLNVWVNLPMFDPTAGADVVVRLSRDGRMNILFGLVLPFIIPVVVKLSFGISGFLETAPLHSLIWIIALWAFLPASLILRGLALLRIAELILQTREANCAKQDAALAHA
jgi:hypothetical protein